MKSVPNELTVFEFKIPAGFEINYEEKFDNEEEDFRVNSEIPT